MKLRVNGEEQDFPSDISLKELISQMGLTDLRFAVAINREVIPRSELFKVEIKDGDDIEIVHAVGGG